MWQPGIRQWITRNPGEILYCSGSLFLHMLLEIHLYCQLLHYLINLFVSVFLHASYKLFNPMLAKTSMGVQKTLFLLFPRFLSFIYNSWHLAGCRDSNLRHCNAATERPLSQKVAGKKPYLTKPDLT